MGCIGGEATLEFERIGQAVALGIVALNFLLAAYGSSLIKDRLPARLWRGIHIGNYLAVVLISFHAGLAGTDAGRWWYISIAVTPIALTGAAVLLRVALLGGNERARIVRPAAADAAAVSAPGGSRSRETLSLVVLEASDEAVGVRRLVLARVGGGPLPEWDPGAHITLVLPDGLTRQYSLCGDPADRDRYEIAVLRAEDSRGGSRWLHDSVLPGTVIEAWFPENHFPLVAARVVVHAADEHESRFDVPGMIRAVGGEIYSCGPAELLDTVQAVAPLDHVHVERFTAVERPGLPRAEFTVECRRSGRDVVVPASAGMLETLEEAGIPVIASCRTGVCGSCETVVLDGVPEHLDSVIPDDEKDELAIMYPCVSRAVGSRIAVDL